jgi:two-component system, LytTR family, sensor kinase
MKPRFLQKFRHMWIEMAVLPFFIVPLCYYFYGNNIFQSWQSFMVKTLPWYVMAMFVSIIANFIRLYMIQRYPLLEDWKKRVPLSFLAYILNAVFFTQITYFLMAASRYEGLAPSREKINLLLLMVVMSVMIIGTLYEVVTFFEQWKKAQAESEQLEKLSLEMQFQSLQSQLNPHFLFNSLNVLSSLITENPRRAEDFVDELSNVYRYLLRSNEREFATVQEELRFAQSYFHLLETRHEKGVSLQVKVSSQIQAGKIPAMSLQILLENAVKHNEVSEEQPLWIHIFDKNDQLVVRNNIRPKARKAASNKVGLDNLRQRYALMGVDGFEARTVEGDFEVRLPLV